MENPKTYISIINTMKSVGAVAKGEFNTYDKYKFRGIDAVMNALGPAMRQNGIFCTPHVISHIQEARDSRKGEKLMYTIVHVEYTFYADDGSNVKADVYGEAMDRSDKSTNKAMSAAFKYALFQTFCIPTEDFIDTETESPEPEQQKPINKIQTGDDPDQNASEDLSAVKRGRQQKKPEAPVEDRTGQPAYPPIEQIVSDIEAYMSTHDKIKAFMDGQLKQQNARDIHELAFTNEKFLIACWNKWCNKG